MLIGDRERIAVHAIPRTELAFEVGRPQIIRRARHDRHDARMLMGAPTAAAAHEAAPREKIGGGAWRRPILDLGMPAAQDLEQFAGAPIRMQAAKLAEQFREARAHRGRRRVWASAAVGEPARPVLGEARQPLVPDAATHAIPHAELGHGKVITHRVAYELPSLVHGITLRPGHHRPRAFEFCDAG